MTESEAAPTPEATTAGGKPGLHLLSWRDPAVVAVAIVALASGFAQFGAVAALGDVAKTFGHPVHGGSLAARAGLSGTTLGIGLAVIRLASIGGLPLAGLADRAGRRRMLLICCSIGLVFTALASTSPTYWAFVAIFALGRPLLSSTNALAQVNAGELTSSAHRAKAVALVSAGYGVGAGLIAVIYSLSRNTLGFRGVFALALVPLAFLPLLARRLVEPERFRLEAASEQGEPVLGPIGPPFRGRLLIVAIVGFSISVITGPANSFVFVYAQDVRHVSGALTAAMVVIAAPAGLVGLLIGRWSADRFGRRPTCTVTVAGVATAGIIAYSGSPEALFIGYACGVLAGGAFAPATGAFINELFPTSVRASVAGWYIAAGVLGAVSGLVIFGKVADVASHLGLAAVITFLPALPVVGLLWLLPESKGLEPEALVPTPRRRSSQP
jgi:MFS family permease